MLVLTNYYNVENRDNGYLNLFNLKALTTTVMALIDIAPSKASFEIDITYLILNNIDRSWARRFISLTPLSVFGKIYLQSSSSIT
jgi:hypothetical protein